MGSGAKPPQKLGSFREFCVKSNLTLQSVGLLLTVSYRKKIGGAGCITSSPNNFVGGAAAPPAAMV